MFYLLIGFGLLIRFLLIPVAGFKADIAFWKGWGLAVADKGIIWLVNNTNYNYPPGFAYVLWLINKIYALFRNPYNIGEYWADNNVFYLFLIKIITIAADLLIVWLIIKIARKLEVKSWKWVRILALFYFFNPAVIYDGVIWGQVDQFGLALFLLSVYFVLTDRFRLGAVIFTISWLMKFQNIIFIPLFFLFIWRKYSFADLLKSAGIMVITFLIAVSPFIVNRQIDRLVWLMTINSDWFPWYSLNAFNGWWIAAGLNGMKMVDKHLVYGITSAKQFGLMLFTFAYFIATVTVFFSKKENLFRNFILGCSLAVFAFFHLLTQSHERYLFPLMGFFPLLINMRVLNPNYKAQMSNQAQRSNYKKFEFWNLNLIWNWDFVIWILVSIFFLINMYLSMGWNYPDQVIPAFTREQTVGMTFWLSVIQIILFGVFAVWFLRRSISKNAGLISLMGIFLITGLYLKNYSYFSGKPISLTLLTPIQSKQDYLEPVYNKTVDSARGVKFWERLSVNYYFYEKGIGSHADSEITYHLGNRFSQFSSDFGIDTEGNEAAKVYFSVSGDGRELFKSEIKGRFDPPGTAKINIKGVNYLTLKITKAGESNYGAHADWLNPILLR